MKTIKRNAFKIFLYPFLSHPRAIGETYFEHLFFAMKSGFRMAVSGLACMLHSIFPFIFVNTASKTVEKLSNEFEQRRNK